MAAEPPKGTAPPGGPLSQPPTNVGWGASFVISLKAQMATWAVGVVISCLAVFSSYFTENIRIALNRADLRSKFYEELALDLSEYVFDAELVVEHLDRGQTGADEMKSTIDDYNRSITDLRKREYVFLSWIGRYWGKSKVTELQDTYAAIKTLDAAFHDLNDEFDAVYVKKTKLAVDPDKIRKALVPLKPALSAVQEKTKTLLIDLQ
jgi:hypothetical protein